MQRPILILAVVASVLLLDACGGGAGGNGDDTAALDDGESATGEATPGGEPPADDPEAVRPYVEDLLADYDRVVNQIIADPGIAADRDDTLVQEYLSLFEPDSQFAEEALAAWVDAGEAGMSVQPFSEEHPANVTTLDGDIEAVSGDEVRFPTCNEQRRLVYDDQDRLTERVPHTAQPGGAIAVRVDGEWRLRRLDLSSVRATCANEGT